MGKWAQFVVINYFALCEGKCKKEVRKKKSGKESSSKCLETHILTYIFIYFRYLQDLQHFEKYWTDSKYSQGGLRAATAIKKKLKPLVGTI